MGTTRQPFTYHGSKAKLAPMIIRLIPPHKHYCEPYAGSCAVLFAKSKSKLESINDLNNSLISVYRTLQNKPDDLFKEATAMLHHEGLYKHYTEKIKDKDATELEIATAFLYLQWCSFSGKQGAFGFIVESKRIPTFYINKHKFLKYRDWFIVRFDNVQIFQRDAVHVIKNIDHANTFFFADPPYINTSHGQYAKFTEADYIKLLETLSSLKGAFLMTTYNDDIIKDYVSKNNWCKTDALSAYGFNSIHKNEVRKVEAFTSNKVLGELFS